MPYGRNGPWYRGGVPRSYVAPSIFVSLGFAICLTVVAIFMIFAGSVMTGVAYAKPKPPFDTPFFIKGNENNPIRVIGPIVLGIGCTLLLTAITLCCVAACLSKRQENKRHEQQIQQPLNSGGNLQTHITTSYPQQQAPQGYNPTNSPYPQQQAPQGYNPTNSPYPQQQAPQDFDPTVPTCPPQSGYSYPSNPQVNYPPPGFYPPNVYPPPVNNMAPQNPQYGSATHPSVEPTLQPYNNYSKPPSNNPDSYLLNDAPPSYEATEKRTQLQ